jgi:Zn-dependent protease/predicted transcriptional regulator
MRWSWKLGTLAGIDVFMHATFLLLVGWVALAHWMAEHSVIAVLAGTAFILALFGCVVLHELGHALTARRFGIRTRDITLLPIGGVARLERIPEEPVQELLVALAGPAVNLVIAAALALVLALSSGLPDAESMGVGAGPFLPRLLVVNVFLAGFNLLPAFPMDGGRVLRALLATRITHARATEIAASIGQGMALLFGFVGLFTNPFLIFIALFVWLGASAEAASEQVRNAFSGLPVSRAMQTDFEALAPGDRLERAVELTLAGSQTDFPVIEAGTVVGLLRQGDLLAGLAGSGGQASVSQFMQEVPLAVQASAMLDEVFAQLEGRQCRTVPVLDGGRLVGMLTMENLGEFVRIQGALAAAGVRRATRPAQQPTTSKSLRG